MHKLKDNAPNNSNTMSIYTPEITNTWGPIPSPPQNWTWEKLMDEAYYEAQQANKNNEVPVGAIIVHLDGTIIARSYNSPIKLSDPTAHAEILAIRSAGMYKNTYRLNDCIMIVTLEPCLMCVGAIIHARLKGIVYGAAEKNTGAITSCISGLDLHFHNHTTWHIGGIQGQQCAKILHTFFSQRRSYTSSLSKDHSRMCASIKNQKTKYS